MRKSAATIGLIISITLVGLNYEAPMASAATTSYEIKELKVFIVENSKKLEEKMVENSKKLEEKMEKNKVEMNIKLDQKFNEVFYVPLVAVVINSVILYGGKIDLENSGREKVDSASASFSNRVRVNEQFYWGSFIAICVIMYYAMMASKH
jgi:hypothetical protein